MISLPDMQSCLPVKSCKRFQLNCLPETETA